MSNTSRRTFLKVTAAVAAAATAGAGRLAAKPLGLPIGLQLYSVRELLPKDFDGTLAKVRAAGYTEVEAAGYYDRTAAEFRHSMDKAGLRCVSTHHPLSVLKPRLGELIEYGHELGLGYIP
ncbi:MAG TPA: twin-arginine translocation signal domain-containing protein, partial [Terracidiphilus sp.]|nr:twin-arginine translocation signal domain-containing protein [Terracidiphilus sp.]